MPDTASSVSAVIVGAGHRSMLYASYATEHPEELRIVGVVEPDPHRRRQAAEKFAIPDRHCFRSVEELTALPRLADAAINGTMDPLHVPTSLPLLAAGYELLLEKPFATSLEEMGKLVAAARQHRRKVMICHVLRYAPFYAAIRERVAAGEIGELIHLQATEHVSYHHMATAFVRGKWGNRADCGSAMLMAKCCHDLDLLTWLKNGVAPARVASFGNRTQFRPEKAPSGAGTRCLTDCAIEETCFYSARKLYLDTPDRWKFYVWAGLEGNGDLTLARRIESLKGDNPYGRCVWRCDNDVVDHQTVAIDFTDGATATLTMVGGAARASRGLHLIGTHGEIEGKFEESRFTIRTMDPRPGKEFLEQAVEVHIHGDMHGARGGHGGGDLRLVADFVRTLRGERPSPSCTSLDDSIHGHLIGFAADQAMETGSVVDLAAWAPAAGNWIHPTK